jgi:branched-chain amino acid transport system substrate-binding protein
MKRAVITKRKWLALAVALLAITLFTAASSAQAADEIRIGFLSPLSGGFAKPGTECKDGFQLFWDQAGNTAGGKPVKVIYGDSGCNPDKTINQARRLVHQEKVHFLVGPLCGHAGIALAQVAKETQTPLILFVAAADKLTKWDRHPLIVRTGFSSSQDAHPFGEWLVKEKGVKSATFIGQDYAFGQEKTLGAVETFKKAGGKVDKIIWAPLSTKDYGPLLAGIPSDTGAVVATVVGGNRVLFFQQWFDFGFDRKHKIYGLHWLQTDALDSLDNDERAVGLIGNVLPYAQGIGTPENKKFLEAYIAKHNAIPSYLVEMAYTSGLFAKAALDSIQGMAGDKEAFMAAVRKAKVVAPRGPLKLDAYDNPIQNTYVCEIVQLDHPKLGKVLINKPVKTFEEVSQFWTWSPDEYLKKGPYKK